MRAFDQTGNVRQREFLLVDIHDAELRAYGGNLARKKEIVALNKTDAMTQADIEAKRAALARASRKTVHIVSGVSGQGVQPLLHELMKLVDKQRAPTRQAA